MSASGRPSPQDTDFSSRARFPRAWPRRGHLGRGRCLAERGRPTQRRLARQQPLALPCYIGASGGAPGIWRPQLELLRPRSRRFCGLPPGWPQQLHLESPRLGRVGLQVRAQPFAARMLPHLHACRSILTPLPIAAPSRHEKLCDGPWSVTSTRRRVYVCEKDKRIRMARLVIGSFSPN
jgi:hypothetical protein